MTYEYMVSTLQVDKSLNGGCSTRIDNANGNVSQSHKSMSFSYDNIGCSERTQIYIVMLYTESVCVKEILQGEATLICMLS